MTFSWAMMQLSQRFLNSSPRAPPLCTFHMLLLSHQMFVLFERKCPAKWTSQDIPPGFQFEANVYIPFKVHISVRDVNLNCIYLQRYMISHSSVREDVAQRKSMNECSEVKQTSTDFPCSVSREQWTLCRKHVNRNTFHVRNTLLTSDYLNQVC